jgi:hypothetical protein
MKIARVFIGYECSVEDLGEEICIDLPEEASFKSGETIDVLIPRSH